MNRRPQSASASAASSAREALTDRSPVALPGSAWRQRFRARMKTWYRRHARDLPWRGTGDLYAIWVSEIMLQQTQVATVVPYYTRFLKRFPDVRALAAAEEREVLQYWEGLGYYRRARQLHAAAQDVVRQHGGAFPATFSEVLALPGIGRYTAGAILSIGRDARLPILEANTIRVFCRLLDYHEPPQKAAGQQLLWQFAEALLPRAETGLFNQSLMELGAEICTPRSPACERCPVATLCAARQAGTAEELPWTRPKTVTAVRHATVLVRDAERVLVRRCGDRERWAGMWDFPRFDEETFPELAAGELFAAAAIERALERRLGVQAKLRGRLTTIKHTVTRFRITLDCYHAQLVSQTRSPAEEQLRWLAPGELASLPLSVTARRLCNWLE